MWRIVLYLDTQIKRPLRMENVVFELATSCELCHCLFGRERLW